MKPLLILLATGLWSGAPGNMSLVIVDNSTGAVMEHMADNITQEDCESTKRVISAGAQATVKCVPTSEDK